MLSFFKTALSKWLNSEGARYFWRYFCLVVFLGPFALYLLTMQGQFLERPSALDTGVVTVAAILGGLVLNAGLNLKGSKKKEAIQVAQKFIAVVILMIIFQPALYFVDLLDGIDLGSFKLDSSVAWVRAGFFWVAAGCFYLGIILFIVALVDLVYAMIGMEHLGDASQGNDEGEV